MRKQSGFTYLLILFLIVILAISMLVAGTLEHYAKVRSDEAELLRIGAEFRQGLARYRNSVEPRTFPTSLDELVLDRRSGVLRRHLRKIYVDPISRTRDWGVVLEGGQIVGVYSKSQRRPMKVAGFDPEDSALEGSEHYSDWIFTPLRVLTDAERTEAGR